MASVDVVIPCYQHGHFLRSCVDSVLSQSVEEVRILIIDNASTDDSAKVARQIALKDKRVEIVLRSVNLGPHASFNEGVDWASGDYLMILCSDDLLAPGSLPKMLSIMEQHPDVSFAYGTDIHWRDGEVFPEAGVLASTAAHWRVRDGKAFIVERCRNPERYIAAGMVLARTAAHKAAGHYRTELPHTDDFEMLLRLALLGRVADISDVVGIKRIHGSNRTNDFLAERTRDLDERLAALQSFFSHEGEDMDDARALARLGRRGIAERAYWCGMKDLAHGQRSAMGLLKLALKIDPKMAVLPPFGYLSRMDRPLLESVRRASAKK